MKDKGVPAEAACKAAEVSTSSHDDWSAKPPAGPTAAEWDEALIVNELHDLHAHLHAHLHGTCDSRRMTIDLRRRHSCVNHERTERLMAANGIVAAHRRRK